MIRPGLILLFLVLGLLPVQAERILSDQASVSMWTVGPGPELYAAFGHSALRIQDPVLGIDRIYNFGTFDFATPNFYLKFIRGDLDYQLSAAVGLEVLEEYRDVTHQLVIEQDLHLTPEEMDAMLVALETNLQPENAAYRYDFVRDNCSTRISNVVAAVVPVRWPDRTGKTQTIREMVQPYVMDRPAVRAGINLLFSAATDRPPTPAEAMFLPEEMEKAFAGAVIEGSGGALAADPTKTASRRPLVRETRVLCPGPRLPAPALDWFTITVWIIAAAGVWGSLADWRWLRRLDLPLFLLVGLIGIFLLLLWLGTRHWVLHGNWNLLWAWPTHWLIWFFPAGFRRGYWRFHAAAMFLLIPLLFLLPQSFPTFIPALLLLLGFRAWTRAKI